MPLTVNHVTATAGVSAYFGKDIVDGWPLGPLKMAQNQTFFYDPHQDAMQRLWFLSQTSNYTAGTGTLAAFPGTQNAWFRQSSAVPGTASVWETDNESD